MVKPSDRYNVVDGDKPSRLSSQDEALRDTRQIEYLPSENDQEGNIEPRQGKTIFHKDGERTITLSKKANPSKVGRLMFNFLDADFRKFVQNANYSIQSSLFKRDPGSLESCLNILSKNIEHFRIQYDEWSNREWIWSAFDNHSFDFLEKDFASLQDKWNNEKELIYYILSCLDKSRDSESKPSLIVRLARLADYARNNDEQSVLKLAETLIPEWNVKSAVAVAGFASATEHFPASAPELYVGLRGRESPPQFVKRVYEPWLGQGLTRAHIRRLDPTLSNAINNWLARPENEWPDDVDLPTKAQQNSRDLDALRAASPDGELRSVLGGFTAREADRIRSANQRRQK